MARFVSQHREFAHGVRPGKEAHLGPDGVMVPEQRELIANFSPDLRTDADLALALSTFTFRGLPIYENGKEVSPAMRVSVYDSEVARLQEGLTEGEEELIVAALRSSSHLGTAFVESVPVAALKPWNGYDDVTDADRVVELALAIDADLAQVLQYERENASRPEFVAALKEAIDSADETIVVSA